jgi:hypothetical protein
MKNPLNVLRRSAISVTSVKNNSLKLVRRSYYSVALYLPLYLSEELEVLSRIIEADKL